MKQTRITIEMKPEHRARVLELAANRGEKGLSAVMAEALQLYLADQDSREHAIRKAIGLKGSMSPRDAAGLLARTRNIRENWR